jgi:hypothetical protein
MSVIGFRCFPDAFAFVVLNGTQQNPHVIAHEKISFPSDYAWGETMSWLRKQTIELLGNYDISSASLKVTEPASRQKSIKRAQAIK